MLISLGEGRRASHLFMGKGRELETRGVLGGRTAGCGESQSPSWLCPLA